MVLGRAFGVGLAWIATSAIYSTYGNTLFLRTFGDPYAHTFVRFALSSGLGLAWTAQTDRALLRDLPFYSRRLLVPSALLMTANLMNSLGMMRSGVTVTYVVKSLIPFFTVMICRLRGQEFSNAVYASLVPVCLGVSIASATDCDFDMSGFACALVSTLAQTLLNVASRERIKELGLAGSEAFLVMATTCTLLTLPLLLVSYLTLEDGLVKVLMHGGDETFSAPMAASTIVFLASFAYTVEYTLNFLYLPLCSSLAFSVTDITRRLGTIVFGAVLFSKPLSPLNAAGVLISLAGVISYTMVAKVGGSRAIHHRSRSSSSMVKSPSSKISGSWVSQYGAMTVVPRRQRRQVASSSDEAVKAIEEGDWSPPLSQSSSESQQSNDNDVDRDGEARLRRRETSRILQATDDSSLGIAPEALYSPAEMRALRRISTAPLLSRRRSAPLLPQSSRDTESIGTSQPEEEPWSDPRDISEPMPFPARRQSSGRRSTK